MPEYIAIIWDDEAAWEAADDETRAKEMQAHVDFAARHGASLRGGNRLRPSAMTTSIRREGDSVTVSDGAFAETKEHIGGYYVFEAADLDEALAIAREVPAAFGGVELRPIWPMEEG
jgi:hypothetical protein